MKYTQLIKAIDSASQQLLGRAAVVVNQSLVIRNWLVGAYIVEFEQHGEDRAKYGARLLPRLAADLKKRKVSGASPDMLERMRQVYFIYPQLGPEISASVMRKLTIHSRGDDAAQNPSSRLCHSSAEKALAIPTSVVSKFNQRAHSPISASPVRKFTGNITPLSANAVLHFSWTQLIELIRIDDPLKRAFYENECLKANWSVRQLQRQIGSLLFERTGLSRNKAAVIARARRQEPPETIADLLRDPYVLEFTGLAERPEYTESELEKALLDHLQLFLLELGTGFLFEARQRRITVGNEHDYIDLVFYHRHLRCHVLLDLKTRPFQHGDAGQMNFYLNWWRQNVTARDEQPPVGVILCSDKDRTKVQFATAGMDNKLFVSRYLTALPAVEQLQHFVETARARTETIMEQQRAAGKTPSSRKR
jgi:predicted nuclease of restriction endonuclease-like (RecB) superfamily